MLQKLSSLVRGSLQKFFAFFSNQFLGTLIALMVIGPLAAWVGGWFTGPNSYRIYFVGDLKQNGVLDSWWGIKDALSDEQIDGVKVEMVSVDASPDDAEKVSKIIVGKEDTILVVGHFSSTASSRALNQYMLADPPIPVILPIESNPDLDVRDNSRTYSPLIRLVPTDDLQAEEAVNFVEEFGAKRIWVIEDTQLNPKYTQYIAAEFIKLIQDRYDRKRYLANCEERARSVSYDCTTTKKWASNHFRAEVVLRTNLLNPPPLNLVQSLDIDFVFFAGQEENCLLATSELANFFKDLPKKPNLLAAKGCERRLDKFPNSKIEGTYTINYVPPSDFYDPAYPSRPGKEAGLILKQIFDRVRQSRSSIKGIVDTGLPSAFRYIFKWRSASDVRLALASEMQKSIEKTAFLIDPTAANRYDLKFKKDGRVIGKNFFVWQLINSGDKLQFVDYRKTSAMKVTYQNKSNNKSFSRKNRLVME